MEKKAVINKIASVVGWEANFAGDLNAMHEAEKVLVKGQKARCLNLLSDLVGNDQWEGFPGDNDGAEKWLWAIHSATAAQRAEAFLRTLNLWEDTE